MDRSTHTRPKARSAYGGALGPALALLLVAPMAFFLVSIAAMAVAGGSVLALLLPLFLRRRPRRPTRDDDCIVLDRDQYSRVDDDQPRLPRR